MSNFKFKIGDAVKVSKFNYYSITTKGSYGIITKRLTIDDLNYYKIKWIYVQDWASPSPHWDSFDILEDTLELIYDSVLDNPHNKKYEKVIRKIHSMYAKQKFKFEVIK